LTGIRSPFDLGSFPTIQPLMISYVIDVGSVRDPPTVVVPEVAIPSIPPVHGSS
jgi:hypothetical protein